MSISRRSAVKAGIAAILASATPASFSQGDGAGKRVLVIGGGPAGLCAAYELHRAGAELLVFEARPIAGGRIMTVREPFSDGLYAEGGAMILGSRVIEEYVEEFSLPTVPADFS